MRLYLALLPLVALLTLSGELAAAKTHASEEFREVAVDAASLIDQSTLSPEALAQIVAKLSPACQKEIQGSSSNAEQSQLKLTYFNVPGRGELSRLTFVAGGIAFEDERIDGAKMKELKPSLPLGQLPVLQVDSATYPQSMAIARYAAKLGGLYPADPLAALKVDAVIETIVDIRAAAGEIRWRTADETAKAEKTKKLLEETLPKQFGFIEKSLVGKFMLGDTLSLADLAVFDLVENSLKVSFPDFELAKYAKLEAQVAGVKANERIAAYLSK